jgi:DivIVA domain-containing protein
MQLTPLDIYQREFRRKRLNGLDPDDVEQFLFQVAEGLEVLLQENAQLAARAAKGPPQPKSDGTEASGAQPRQDARREVDQARQEARRITDEATAQAKAAIDNARSEARRIIDAAHARTPQAPAGATAHDPKARQFAIDYQSLLVKHLAQVTHHLEDADDARRDNPAVEPTRSSEENTTELGERAQ